MITNIIKGLLKIASCVYCKIFETTTDLADDSGVTLLGKLFVPLVIVYVVYVSKNNVRRKSRCRSLDSLDTETEMTELDELAENNSISSGSYVLDSCFSTSTLGNSPISNNRTPARLKPILRRSRTPFSMVESSVLQNTANNLGNMGNTTENLVSTIGSESDFQPLPRLDTFRIRESRIATNNGNNNDNPVENNPATPGPSANNILSAPAIPAAESASVRIPQRRRYESTSTARNQSPASSRRRRRH